MRIPAFELLEYFAANMAACEHNLGTSNLPPLPLEDLGPLEDVDLEHPYPGGSPPLREAVAAASGVAPEQVLITAGASEANFVVALALLEPGSRVAVETPYYEPMAKIFHLLGMEVSFLPRPFEVSYRPDPDALSGLREADLVVLTNLHNPGGTRMDRAFLEDLAFRAEEGGFLILMDEIFREAAPDRAPPCALTLSDRFVVTSSLSKVYGLGGLRIGWVLADDRLMERVRGAQALASVAPASPSEALALRALGRADRVRERNRRLVTTNRDRVNRWVEGRDDVEWVVPDGFVSFPRTTKDVEEVVRVALRKHGTLVLPGRLFGARDHFRLCFGMETEEVEAGLEGLGRALDAC